MKKKIVVANWKMNPTTLVEAEKLFDGVKKKASRLSNVQTVLCPPFVYLTELFVTYSGNKIKFGAQDVFWEEKGARTGEISPLMLKSIGVEYSIIGHSERRELGEDNDMVHKKVLAALKAGLYVVLCVGEKERDDNALYLSFLKEELQSALIGVSKNQLNNIIIAYEPIWAIGKGAKAAMQPSDIHEMSLFIKKILVEKYGKSLGLKVPILYGGSVVPTNVETMFSRGAVNGFLVGGASLDVDSFDFILKHVNNN